MSFQGTRETKSFQLNHPSGQRSHLDYTRDKGMRKRVIANATFGGSTIFDAAADFTVFKVGDRIEVSGTAGGLNNGERLVLAVVASQLTVDWPVKAEGPTPNVEIRTP